MVQFNIGSRTNGGGRLPARILSSTKICNLLLALNLMFMGGLLLRGLPGSINCGPELKIDDEESLASGEAGVRPGRIVAKIDTAAATTDAAGTNDTFSLSPKSKQRSFFDIASKTGTDKVGGSINQPGCLKDESKCSFDSKNPKCRPYGHFYHTIYQRWLGEYSTDDAEPFQFVEIGYFEGRGFEAYQEFLPKAEAHSIEISCLPKGPREEGKWPWGNFGEKHRQYAGLRENDRLHCGDASDVGFLNEVWTGHMKRDGAPPLKVVVDDASHIAKHMAQTVFFWLPRIEPGGILIIEDIQPTVVANSFRTRFLPQIMADLHYCGDSRFPDSECFPTIQRFLHSIHCEMHICVFERNDTPAEEPSLEESTFPQNALDISKCEALK